MISAIRLSEGSVDDAVYGPEEEVQPYVMEWDNDAGVRQPFQVHLVLTAGFERRQGYVRCKTVVHFILPLTHCVIRQLEN